MTQTEFLNHVIATLGTLANRWTFKHVYSNNACEVAFLGSGRIVQIVYNEAWLVIDAADNSRDHWLTGLLRGGKRDDAGNIVAPFKYGDMVRVVNEQSCRFGNVYKCVGYSDHMKSVAVELEDGSTEALLASEVKRDDAGEVKCV